MVLKVLLIRRKKTIISNTATTTNKMTITTTIDIHATINVLDSDLDVGVVVEVD